MCGTCHVAGLILFEVSICKGYIQHVDGVDFVDENRTMVDQKLELWRWTLEAKRF
jgi:hypothetical protein